MSERVFHLHGTVPIPVGHRVEVYVYALRGFVGWKPSPYEPLVTDLDTGVVYGRTWQYAETNRVEELPFAVRSDLQLAERVQGRVRATRIVHGRLPGDGADAWVTSLLVAPDA